MHSLSLLFGLLATSVTSSLAAAVPPVNVPMHKYNGNVNQGTYFVRVRDGADKTGIVSLVEGVMGTAVAHNWNAEFINAFASMSSYLYNRATL